MNRALRAATTGVLLLSPFALAACSAGQVTQTATQDRDKSGPMAQTGPLTLRSVELAYPRTGLYEEGDDAELGMVIVNIGSEDDTLIDVEGEAFESAEIVGAEPSGTGDTGSGSTGAGSGSAAADEIVVPGDSSVIIGEDGPSITLVGLQEELTAAEHIELTLTFENAGELTVLASVSTPDRELPREEGFDFHQEEAVNEGQEENTEVAGGAGQD